MNPQLWWFLARAGGLVAWGLLTLTVVLGAVLRTRLFPRLRPAPVAQLHRFLASLAMTFTGLHLTGLLLDGYIGFGARDVLVPFGASWRPVAVGLGVISVYLMIAVAVTSAAMRHLPRRAWALVHRTSYLTFWLATAHTLSAGTDAGHPAVLAAMVLGAAMVIFLTVLRVLCPDPDSASGAGPLWHRLTVRRIERHGTDAVAVVLSVPTRSRVAFGHRPGQHVLLRMPAPEQGTAAAVRPYSIYAQEGDEIRIAVREVPGGTVSSWVTRAVRPGSTVEVSTPRGTFGTTPDPGNCRHVLLIGAGSGVTPLLSIATAVLAGEAESRVTFLLANRSPDRIMLADELDVLRRRHPHRFRLLHVLSHGARSPGISGRLGPDLLRDLAGSLHLDTVDEAYLCGPESLSADVRVFLAERGVDPTRVHTEQFVRSAPTGTSDPTGPGPTGPAGEGPAPPTFGAAGGSEVTIVTGGRRERVQVRAGESVLDAGLRVGLDLPYSCRAGVCGSCTAVSTNSAGGADAAGTPVQTCQTQAGAGDLVIDFDRSLVR